MGTVEEDICWELWPPVRLDPHTRVYTKIQHAQGSKKKFNNDERERKRWAGLDVAQLAECFERTHKAPGLVLSTM